MSPGAGVQPIPILRLGRRAFGLRDRAAGDLRPLLLEAARLVPIAQAERRVLVLENPGLKGTYAITATLYAGLQVILPREAAPCHHHTPAALRLVVEGRGAYTTAPQQISPAFFGYYMEALDRPRPGA